MLRLGTLANISLLEAIRFKASASKGHDSALFNLGTCYANGDGVRRDPAEAVRIFRTLADKGKPSGMYGLGVSYYNGSGVPKDKAKAFELLSAASSMGYEKASALLTADGKALRPVSEISIPNMAGDMVGTIIGEIFGGTDRD